MRAAVCWKFAKALELGPATHGIDSSTTDPVLEILALTDGRGADYGFDAAGVTGTLDLVIAATRAGATCVVIGRSMEAVEVNLDTRYKLDEIAQAFDDMHHGRVTRGVVIMAES